VDTIRYGNRKLIEHEGRFLRYLDEQFLGEACRKKAFAWLYEAQPYKLEVTRTPLGFEGLIRDTTGAGVTASAKFYRAESETDDDVWARLTDWAARYIGDRNTDKGNDHE